MIVAKHPDRSPRVPRLVPTIADVKLADPALADLHALNEAAVPHVNALDRTALGALLGEAALLRGARVAGRLVGFVAGFTPGCKYASANFLWFCDRYDDFLYIDRIVVVARLRRAGIGAALYADMVDQCRKRAITAVTCEVNERPPNPGSHRFHHRLGFEPVGVVHHPGGKRVRMYRLPVSGRN